MISSSRTRAHRDTTTGDGYCLTRCRLNHLRALPHGDQRLGGYRGETSVRDKVKEEWLTWWAEHCRWGARGAVCVSRTGMPPKCHEGCLRRWSCPRWSTPPDRLRPHGCLEACSTVGVEERVTDNELDLSHRNKKRECLFVVFTLNVTLSTKLAASSSFSFVLSRLLPCLSYCKRHKPHFYSLNRHTHVC